MEFKELFYDLYNRGVGRPCDAQIYFKMTVMNTAVNVLSIERSASSAPYILPLYGQSSLKRR